MSELNQCLKPKRPLELILADIQTIMQEAQHPEDEQHLENLMDEIFYLEEKSKSKVEQWLWVYEQVKSSQEIVKERIARLKHIQECATKIKEKMSLRLQAMIEQRNGEPLNGETGKFCLEKNGGMPALDIDMVDSEGRTRFVKKEYLEIVGETGFLPMHWWDTKEIQFLDREQVRKDLNAGLFTCSFARVFRGNHIRVRPLGVMDVR